MIEAWLEMIGSSSHCFRPFSHFSMLVFYFYYYFSSLVKNLNNYLFVICLWFILFICHYLYVICDLKIISFNEIDNNTLMSLKTLVY